MVDTHGTMHLADYNIQRRFVTDVATNSTQPTMHSVHFKLALFIILQQKYVLRCKTD